MCFIMFKPRLRPYSLAQSLCVQVTFSGALSLLQVEEGEGEEVVAEGQGVMFDWQVVVVVEEEEEEVVVGLILD